MDERRKEIADDRGDGLGLVEQSARTWDLMASRKVDVAVHDGDRVVARLTARPVRLKPDRLAGVVYNGAV